MEFFLKHKKYFIFAVAIVFAGAIVEAPCFKDSQQIGIIQTIIAAFSLIAVFEIAYLTSQQSERAAKIQLENMLYEQFMNVKFNETEIGILDETTKRRLDEMFGDITFTEPCCYIWFKKIVNLTSSNELKVREFQMAFTDNDLSTTTDKHLDERTYKKKDYIATYTVLEKDGAWSLLLLLSDVEDDFKRMISDAVNGVKFKLFIKLKSVYSRKMSSGKNGLFFHDTNNSRSDVSISVSHKMEFFVYALSQISGEKYRLIRLLKVHHERNMDDDGIIE